MIENESAWLVSEPKFMVPRQIRLTRRPLRPRWVNFIPPTIPVRRRSSPIGVAIIGECAHGRWSSRGRRKPSCCARWTSRRPSPAPGEIRVAIEACGVCRTDLHITEGDLPLHKKPVVPGP